MRRGTCRRGTPIAIEVALLAAATVGCSSTPPVIDPGDGGRYSVRLRPTDFGVVIDNPWFPLGPGSRWVYESRHGTSVERVEVVVTQETREILGITATVVRDTESLNGELIEVTFDWYAQDRTGTVWYLGEDSNEYRGGKVVSTEGSWEAGVNGALPGVIMKANPMRGQAYRQEFYSGVAEDLAEVLRVGGSETVPFRAFDGLLVTREWTPLEPRIVEEKYYARGVGLILEMTVQGGSGRTELVRFQSA